MAPNENSLVASPCGINGDVSRDTPALAFGVNYSVFKEPLSDAEPPNGNPVWKGPQAPNRHSPLASVGASPSGPKSRRVGAGERRPCQCLRCGAPRADQGLYGPDREAATRPADFPATGLASHPMGSSGMKRKGRKHQPKVGTKQERGLRPAPGPAGGGGEFRHQRQGRDVLDRHRGDRGAGGRRRSRASPCSSSASAGAPMPGPATAAPCTAGTACP